VAPLSQDSDSFAEFEESLYVQVADTFGKHCRANERWGEDHCEQLIERLDERVQSAVRRVVDRRAAGDGSAGSAAACRALRQAAETMLDDFTQAACGPLAFRQLAAHACSPMLKVGRVRCRGAGVVHCDACCVNRVHTRAACCRLVRGGAVAMQTLVDAVDAMDSQSRDQSASLTQQLEELKQSHAKLVASAADTESSRAELEDTNLALEKELERLRSALAKQVRW
jgi:hypothetical protein